MLGASRTRRRKLKTGSRTGPTVPDRATPESRAAGYGRGTAPAQESGPVGLVLDHSDSGVGSLRARQEVQGPDRFLIPRARPSAAQQSWGRGEVLGLEKKLGEGRMGLIGAATIEGHLSVAGDVQRARPDAVVRQRDPADLDIRVGCDRDLVARFDVRIATLENGPVRTEDRLVVVGVSTERLPAGRPCAAAIEVADVEVLSPAVAGRVLAPARHVQPIAGAVSAPGLGQHDAITTVRQQADVRRRHVGCSPAARVPAAGRTGRATRSSMTSEPLAILLVLPRAFSTATSS